MDASKPKWNFDDKDYRVAPEPLEAWVNVYATHMAAHNSHNDAMRAAAISSGSGKIPDRTAVRMREVTE